MRLLLVEDEKTGKWYYFYWGPVDENESPMILASSGSASNCVIIEINVDAGDLSTVEGVQKILASANDDFVKSRSNKVTDIYYFEGDYSSTLTYLQGLGTIEDLTYHLLVNNCVQNSWTALGKSNVCFKAATCPIIPDVAYAKMLFRGSQFTTLKQFVQREIQSVYEKIFSIMG